MIKSIGQTFLKGWALLFKGDKKRLSLIICLRIVDSSIGPILVFLVSYLIEILTKHDLSSWKFVYLLVILIFILSFLQDLLDPLMKGMQRLASTQINAYIDTLIMRKSASFDSLLPFEDTSYYSQIKAIRENDYFVTVFLNMLVQAWGGIVKLAAGSIVLWGISPFLPLILIISFLPRLYTEVKLNNATFEGREDVIQLRRRAEYFASLPLSINLIQEVKLFGLTPFFKRQYQQISSQLIRTLSQDQKYILLHSLIWGGIQASVVGCAIFYCYSQLKVGAFPISTLFLLVGMIYQLSDGVYQFFGLLAIGQREGLYLVRLLSFLGRDDSLKQGDEKIASSTPPSFKLSQVQFSYPHSAPVLAIENLEIPSGKITAFVGENGSGKSTLIKLLCRFYEPQQGTLYLNSKEIEKYALENIHETSTCLFQDFVKYELTARENIGIGNLKQNFNDRVIMQAADKAGVSSFIELLEEGYDSQLGKLFSGHELSEGQWQRISLARGFMREDEASILIFDEPSAALDAYAEKALMERLMSLGANKTVIIITHRLNTAKKADHIILFKEGKVAESGSHQSLMLLQGSYSQMYEIHCQSLI